MLGIEGLIQLIKDNQADSLDDNMALCVGAFRRWCGGIPLADDLSLLVLEVPNID